MEKHFIKEGMREAQIEEFLMNTFDRAGYSHIDIQRTALGTRIIVYANRPGLVIGRSGSRIKEITEEIKKRFDMENPMVDVKEVENPFLDAQVVAGRIAKSLERGSFYKKVANYYLKEIMRSGAVGVEIKIAGKMGGQRGRLQKFSDGYIKHSGYYADNILERGKATATVKLGTIGIQVSILKHVPEDVSLALKQIKGEEVEDKGSEETE
jgi:small subunit ribosomal protein S3